MIQICGFVWTINFFWITREQQLFSVFGECDVYITDSDGKYDAQHHCSSAEKLGLKPPADNKTK
jgi:hypothetical protein